MNKILCPVDDCEPTKVAARLAGTLAAATGADLTLLAVNEMIGGYMRRDASALLWSPSQLCQSASRFEPGAGQISFTRFR